MGGGDGVGILYLWEDEVLGKFATNTKGRKRRVGGAGKQGQKGAARAQKLGRLTDEGRMSKNKKGGGVKWGS